MEQVGEDGRHDGKIFGVGCLHVVAASVCGLVQLVENGVDFAVIKEKVMRIPAGAQSVVQLRKLVGCGKVAHTAGPVEDKSQTVSDGGNVFFGKLNARHGKTSCYSVVSGYGPMSARPGGAAGLAPAAAGCRRPCGSFGKHLFAERFHLCGGLDGEHDNGDCRVAGADGVDGRIAARRAVVGELHRVHHTVIVGIYQDGRCPDVEKPCKAAFLLAGGDVLQKRGALHGLFIGGVVLEDVHQIRRVLFRLKTVLGRNDGHAVGGAFAERHGLDHIGVQDGGQLKRGVCRDDVDQIATAGDTDAAPVLGLLLEVGLDRLDIEAEKGEVGRKFHGIASYSVFSNRPGGVPVVGRGRFSGCGPARVSHSAERSLLTVCWGVVCAGCGGCLGLWFCFGFRCGGRSGALRCFLYIGDGLPGLAPLCQRFRLGGAVFCGHGHKFVHRLALCLFEIGGAGGCFLLRGRRRLCLFGLGLVLLGGSLGGFALVGQHFVIGPDVIETLKPPDGPGLLFLDLPTVEKMGLCKVVVAFILFGGGFGQFVGVRLGLLLLVAEFPQLAGDRGFLTLLNGQPFLVPLCPSVKQFGAQESLCGLYRVGGVAVAVRLEFQPGSVALHLFGGIEAAHQIVTLEGVVVGANLVEDNSLVGHGVKPPVFSSQNSRRAAGVVGRGCFTVQPC
nr:MAG TPA: hypothetical protein [Caudoviricetes sp.]